MEITKFKVQGIPWRKPLAAFLGVLVLLLACIKIISAISQPAILRESIITKEQEYIYSSMQFLGEYIASHFPGHKILLITRPQTKKTEKHSQMLVQRLLFGLAGILTRKALIKCGGKDFSLQ